MPAPDASGMKSPHSGQSGTSLAEGSGPSLSKSVTDSDDCSEEKSYQTSILATGTGTSAERTGTSGDTPLDDPSAYIAEQQARIRSPFPQARHSKKIKKTSCKVFRPDFPMRILAFGQKYNKKDHPMKYKAKGKYHIPVGYKAIAKWCEDEIGFMTKEDQFGPAFKIVYLPKSEVVADFTNFSWTTNMTELWGSLLTVLEQQDKDMSMFKKGPWHTFGITDDAVQNWFCDKLLSKNQSTVQEYSDYLGMVSPIDDQFIWICYQMMNDPLPPNVYQYVNMTGEVYWNDAAAKDGVSFWKHPHYDKYRSILDRARIPQAQAPVRLGAGVEHQDHVQAAEDPQDFRREREGHLYVLLFKFYHQSLKRKVSGFNR